MVSTLTELESTCQYKFRQLIIFCVLETWILVAVSKLFIFYILAVCAFQELQLLPTIIWRDIIVGFSNSSDRIVNRFIPFSNCRSQRNSSFRIKHNIRRLTRSCVHMPWLHKSIWSTRIPTSDSFILESTTGSMNTTHQLSSVMELRHISYKSTMWKRPPPPNFVDFWTQNN